MGENRTEDEGGILALSGRFWGKLRERLSPRMHFALGPPHPCVNLFDCTSPWGWATTAWCRRWWNGSFKSTGWTSLPQRLKRLKEAFDAAIERLTTPPAMARLVQLRSPESIQLGSPLTTRMSSAALQKMRSTLCRSPAGIPAPFSTRSFRCLARVPIVSVDHALKS
jgi:hypothetical protein